jgi:hypothetical protein
MTRSNGSSEKSSVQPPAITTLSVAGFKSIVDEQTIEIRPLTLLAGANSSGKSSMLQPLLLLKQTLAATYDPGPLLLNGPNAKFTSVGQFWPVRFGQEQRNEFIITIAASNGANYGVAFRWNKKKLEVERNTYGLGRHRFTIKSRSSSEEISDRYRDIRKELSSDGYNEVIRTDRDSSQPKVSKARFVLELAFVIKTHIGAAEEFAIPTFFSSRYPAFDELFQRIREAIHLPGLRGNAERTYPVAAVGPWFPGTFESYTASLIANWGETAPENVKELGDDLRALGLTWKIEAKPLDDTQVELRVGRMPRRKHASVHDLVSIADVGVGVSQVLPVVVALRAARPGQLVYIEQPEIHLHPRAQVAMARLLVNAANRGVRVVAETHSSILLLAVQTLVAEREIDPNFVGLNWFARSDKDGTTLIKSAELDEAGRFGDWPEDFDEVALENENRYLSAAEARLTEK